MTHLEFIQHVGGIARGEVENIDKNGSRDVHKFERWAWSADRHECNDFYPTQIEALQSAIDFASAEEQKNTDEYDAMADIREQSRKEARSGI